MPLSEQVRQVILDGDVSALEALCAADPTVLGPDLWPVAMHQAGSRDVTRLLLARGLDPDLCSAPRKPLHFAVSQCWPDIAAELLEAGADPNIRDGEGFTPLDLYGGLVSGEPDEKAAIIALLREAGAEITVWTALRISDTERALALLEQTPALISTPSPDLGFLPLHVAARMGDLRVVKWLLQHGAEVDAGENTPLWFACQSGSPVDARTHVATALLQSGAAVNRACAEGTALHFAAWRGPAAMVQLLLRHGADPTLADAGGERPVDYARSSQVNPERERCISLLEG